MSATPIKLQVGERHFTTTKDTLQESTFFSALLDRWPTTLPNGSYFIDADGDLFEHILRYLRRGVLPVFYDQARGHDHAKYVALLHEARYFIIEKLINWLNDKLFLKAVTVEYRLEIWDDAMSVRRVHDADDVVVCTPHAIIRKKYLCPRRIFVHYDNPQKCGRDCAKARGRDETEYEEVREWQVLASIEKTRFHADVLLASDE